MKVFLASSPDLSELQIIALLKLVGKEKVNKALVISTAVVPYGLHPRPQWFERSLEPLRNISAEIIETTLEDGEIIPDNLDEYDFVFVSGGNIFYLAHRLQKTGWDEKIRNYVKNDGVYVGSSAGAIILMDNIKYFVPMDDSAKAPEIFSGLGLINEAIIPHADNKKYQKLLAGIAENYRQDGYNVVALNDNQVLLIDGETKTII